MRFARLVLPVLALAAADAPAAAQPAFDRLLIVAPAAPGGGWDQTARALQQVLQTTGLARTVEVENVAGAAGTIGLAQFVDAQRGNGRALIVSGLVMVGATLWNESPVSVTAATPIARLTGEYEVVAVPASSPYRDLPALVAAFRQHPEGFAWGGGSAGGTDHILAGLVAEAAGIDPRRLNYIAFSGGGEAVAALLGGHVRAGISGYSEFAAHIESGRLRAIAISAAARVASIDAPTLKEGGIDVELVNWRAVLAPPRLTARDRQRLNDVVAAAARSAEWQKILVARQWTDWYLDGDAFDGWLREERDRLSRVVARLRGPVSGAPVRAGQRLAPVAVLGGGLVVLSALIARRRPQTGTVEQHAVNASAVSSTAAALIVFVALLPAFGFIVSASLLFAITVVAFRGYPAAPIRRWLAGAVGPLLAGVVFATLVYVGFTRGLDVPLPPGRLWTWMR